MHTTAFIMAVTLLLPLQFACLAMQMAPETALPLPQASRERIDGFLCRLSSAAWMLGGLGPLLAIASADFADPLQKLGPFWRLDFALLGLASTLLLYGHCLLRAGRPEQRRPARMTLAGALAASICLGLCLVGVPG